MISFALLSKYYGLTMSDISNLTLSQYYLYVNSMARIEKIMSGEPESTPVSGKTGAMIARQMFGTRK